MKTLILTPPPPSPRKKGAPLEQDMRQGALFPMQRTLPPGKLTPSTQQVDPADLLSGFARPPEQPVLGPVLGPTLAELLQRGDLTSPYELCKADVGRVLDRTHGRVLVADIGKHVYYDGKRVELESYEEARQRRAKP